MSDLSTTTANQILKLLIPNASRLELIRNADGGYSNKLTIAVDWTVSTDLLAGEKNFAEQVHDIIDISARAIGSHIVKGYEDDLRCLRVENAELKNKIVDLQRYKTAYELNKG